MIFLDTSYIIALLNKNTTKYKEALEISKCLQNEQKIINSTVLLELINGLKKSYYTNKRENIIKKLLHMDKIHYLNYQDYMKSLEIYKQFNYSINYNDCTILKTMTDYNITKIASFDDDFDKINGIDRVYL